MRDRLRDVEKRHADGGKFQNGGDARVWEESPSRRALELIEDYYAACPRGLERSEAADFTIRLRVDRDHDEIEGGSDRFDIVRCKWDMGPAGNRESRDAAAKNHAKPHSAEAEHWLVGCLESFKSCMEGIGGTDQSCHWFQLSYSASTDPQLQFLTTSSHSIGRTAYIFF